MLWNLLVVDCHHNWVSHWYSSPQVAHQVQVFFFFFFLRGPTPDTIRRTASLTRHQLLTSRPPCHPLVVCYKQEVLSNFVTARTDVTLTFPGLTCDIAPKVAHDKSQEVLRVGWLIPFTVFFRFWATALKQQQKFYFPASVLSVQTIMEGRIQFQADDSG